VFRKFDVNLQGFI
jgi:Ca2+-binding EF-hand superfamily protein